jgi:putative phosphonate metabolism protein
MTDVRYAIYYAPEPQEPLWRFGSAVIGYDAATGEAAPAAVPDGLSPERWMAWTAEPRRYGFHATLKAPFRLAVGQTETALAAALATFAAGNAACETTIDVRNLDGFVALVPTVDTPTVFRLERAAVAFFEPFRAPLTQAETARRLAAGLSPRQAALLDRYGYPFVHDEFRFHMTLTGRLPAEVRDAVVAALAVAYRAAVGSRRLHVDSVCLFRQASSAAQFQIIARAPLRRAENT